jgi:hypothetical protein
MKKSVRSIGTIVLGLFLLISLSAQPSTFVDEKGILRWTATKKEVCVFGVNLTSPFGETFDAQDFLGVDHEKAIDADVYHLARMGIDGFRVHVWDNEISDSAGNLVFNKHLQLFDYMLYKLKERGIKIFLTPICYYPSGKQRTSFNNGFQKYFHGKKGCLTDTNSFAAQERYLSQFVSHINQYTGLSYKDDPDIIAFEINNEPFNHSDRPDLTTYYINRMADAIRSSGCKKPLFYNMSHNIEQIDNFCNANIQGGTFQWYPTDLVSHHDQKGNFLPAVDNYIIPFKDHPKFRKLAKVVYEFCPSDVGHSAHLYAAMARSLREAGFQFAAQFSYDPMYLANTNYYAETHYLNLAYTPQIAMGMKIASEVFHRVPLGKNYGRFPDNTNFDVFRLGYEDDQAEMVTDKKFLYANSTLTSPPNPGQLEHVAGTGSSPLIGYEGTGVYLLDRLEEGVWRLELMPDAVWVRDPFESQRLYKNVSVILWKEWPMSIDLPDLGKDFSIDGLNDGNFTKIHAKGDIFKIRPGSYLITRKGRKPSLNRNDKWQNIQLGEFYAPETSYQKTYVLHEPVKEISTTVKKYTISAEIVSLDQPENVEIVIYNSSRERKVIPMENRGYKYTADIPITFVNKEGFLEYFICLKNAGDYFTFPSGEKEYPFYEDFYESNPWRVSVVKPEAPFCLFDACVDGKEISEPYGNTKIDFIPSLSSEKSMMLVQVNNLQSIEHDFSLRSFCRSRVESRTQDLESKKELFISGKSLNNKPCKIQLTLIMKDATAFGGVITLQPEMGLYSISIKDLRKVKTVLLPHQIPNFLSYRDEGRSASVFNIKQVESIQISIGPGVSENQYNEKNGVAIESIGLN